MSDPDPRTDDFGITAEHMETLRKQMQAPPADGPTEGWVLSVAEAFLEVVPAEMLTNLQGRMAAKDAESRFRKHSEVVASLMRTEPRLLDGESLEEVWRNHLKFVDHVMGLWDDAVSLFERGRFATATFLAIACIEEAGKGHVGIMQAIAWHGSGYSGEEVTTKGRSPLRSHPKKHLLAAGAGAVINARLDRLFGWQRVTKFLDDAECGRIEKLRQSTLYAESNENGLILPEQAIAEADALFYVALAGELAAEIIPIADPLLFDRLLSRVTEFENRNGLWASE